MTTIIIKQKISSPKVKAEVKNVVDAAKLRIDKAEKITRETQKPEAIIEQAKQKASEIEAKALLQATKVKADAEKILIENEALLASKKNELKAAETELLKAKEKQERTSQINGLLQLTNDLTRVWWDKGSGAKGSISLYIPDPEKGYAILGHTGYPSYKAPKSSFGVITFNTKNSFIKWKHPVDYERVWKDSGSGADQDGAIWRPIPPSGYVAMGMMASRGHSNKPSEKAMVCIEKKFTKAIKADKSCLLWNDKGSGADRNVSLWFNSQLGTFWAHASHRVPSGEVIHVFDMEMIEKTLSQ
ncbi:MAG: Vps62-related protein [Bacteroidetes bacterium]|nr:Vps62-related protein [Bacteroidota bacterium]